MNTNKLSESNGLLLGAQDHIWNQTFNFINSMSLKCAVQLGIPEIIHKHGKPITLPELISSLPIDISKSPYVDRLMQLLIHSGFFVITKISDNEEEEGYALTPASKLLLRDEPLRVFPFLLMMLDPMLTNPWHQLSEWFQNEFATTNGGTFWELAGQKPKLNSFFNEAMASDARLVGSVFIEHCKEVFDGIISLVDVGGGNGTTAKMIADALPHLKCNVLDLPHVVDGLKGGDNLAFVGGDMFQFIPLADAVILKAKECGKTMELDLTPEARKRQAHRPWLTWLPSFAEDTIKINIDASRKVDDLKTAIAGVLRNHKGERIKGFIGNIGVTSIHVAEMRAIREALLIAKEMKCAKLELESDSETVINAIYGNNEVLSEEYPLIKDCRELLNLKDWNIRAIFQPREKNKLPDAMVELGHSVDVPIKLLEEPPEEVKKLYIDDKIIAARFLI